MACREDGKYYSGNSYNIGYDTNSYKWDDKVTILRFLIAIKKLLLFV